MSLVGTRPPTVDEWDKYELHHRARLATKPGLTGMWQVSGRSNITDLDVTIVDCVKERKSVNDIVDFINKTHPNYIGINIFTQNYEMVKYIIESITITCDCFIGGQVVKSIYLDILRWNTQNRLNIIIGEGEFIIPALVSGRCKQIPEQENDQKVVYRVNKNSEYFPKDISNIFLNRKYLGNEIIYNHYGEKEIAIITSRGCAFDCAFCGGAKSLNKDITTRIRTEESVITEIREILSAYPDIQSIRVLDDLFLRNGKSIDMTNNIFLKFPHLSWRGMVHVLSLRGLNSLFAGMRSITKCNTR